MAEIVTSTKMKNSFGKYLNAVMSGEEVIITKNGKEVARIIPKEKTVTYLTDSLVGILKEEKNKDERELALKEKYGLID